VVPAAARTEINLSYDRENASLDLKVCNEGNDQATLTVSANAYRADGLWTLIVPAGGTAEQRLPIADSSCWYDFSCGGTEF
jgi:phospholipase C